MKLNIKELEKIRDGKRMSMAEFSRMLKLEGSTYRKLITAGGVSVTVKTINRIAHSLHIDPRDLLIR